MKIETYTHTPTGNVLERVTESLRRPDDVIEVKEYDGQGNLLLTREPTPQEVNDLELEEVEELREKARLELPQMIDAAPPDVRAIFLKQLELQDMEQNPEKFRRGHSGG